MTEPVLSVILPIFNGEAFLRKSIESVLRQSFTGYELIVWNDASTDNSMDIVSDYRDARIRLYNNVMNLGLFKTLNLAIGETKSKLIRLWAQDDIMKPHCLETEVDFYRRHPQIAMGHCLYDVIDGSGKVTIPAGRYPEPPELQPDLAVQMMFYYGSLPGNISNVTLRKEVLDRVGCFREDMVIAGDFEMWVRIAERHPIGYINDSLLYGRAHPRQLSRQPNSYVICMREEQEVFMALLTRLPAEIQRYAQRYNLMTRYPMYFHHVVRKIIEGDFRSARAAFREVAKSQHPLFVALFWLLSANRRLYRLKPRFKQSDQPSDGADDSRRSTLVNQLASSSQN